MEEKEISAVVADQTSQVSIIFSVLLCDQSRPVIQGAVSHLLHANKCIVKLGFSLATQQMYIFGLYRIVSLCSRTCLPDFSVVHIDLKKKIILIYTVN